MEKEARSQQVFALERVGRLLSESGGVFVWVICRVEVKGMFQSKSCGGPRQVLYLEKQITPINIRG